MSLKKLKTQFNDLVTSPPIPEQQVIYGPLLSTTLYANVEALPEASTEWGKYAFVGSNWADSERVLYLSKAGVWSNTLLTPDNQNKKLYYFGDVVYRVYYSGLTALSVPEQKLHYWLAINTIVPNTQSLPDVATSADKYAFVGPSFSDSSRKLYFSNGLVWTDTNLTAVEQNLKFYISVSSTNDVYTVGWGGFYKVSVPYSQTTDLGNVSGNVSLAAYNGHKITMSLTGATTITVLPNYCSLTVVLSGEELNLGRYFHVFNQDSSITVGGLVLNSGGSGGIDMAYLEILPNVILGNVTE